MRAGLWARFGMLLGGGFRVPYDPNYVTPCGKTFAQIDADQARYVAAANDALASLREFGCRWWSYMVSHSTFELVIGDAMARGGNLVIVLAACDHISGPVSWEKQQLRVIWDNDREHQSWVFTLQDDFAKFQAVGGIFGWRRNYDLLKHHSLYNTTNTGPQQKDDASDSPDS